jgi:hypothetical protein
MNGLNIPQKKLLEMHIEALFTLDGQSKLVSINEPWDKTKPAPRLYLGKTFDGSIIYKYGYNISFEIIKKLEYYLEKESILEKNYEIKYLDEYINILGSKDYSQEICFYYNDEINESLDHYKKINSENINKINLKYFEWLKEEIKYCQPCCAIIEKNQIVSICRSVRITENAHEAGIETINEYKGKGLAVKILREWANEVQKIGCIALYSTNKENKSSQKVAEKALLNNFGIGISIK